MNYFKQNYNVNFQKNDVEKILVSLNKQ
jgi:hypothetical protein